MATDYPIVGPATIDLRTFQSVLVAAHSPAAGEAPAMYAAIRGYGVDPAVVLAIMQHESSFGKLGIAVGRNNGFGSRYYSGTTAFGATNRGGWAAFPNWASGAAYTAALLASHAKQGSKGGTARSFARWYAPSSDGNNPSSYGVAVVNAINRWRGMAPITAAVPQATATKPKTPAAKGKAPAKGKVAAAMPTLSTGAALGIVGLAVILLAILVLR